MLFRSKDYIAIEQARFGDKLTVIYDIDDEVSCVIPSLLIQPLVENALYHGIKNKRGGGCIVLRGYEDRNGLVFEVEDDGIGMDEAELAAVRVKAPRAQFENRVFLAVGSTSELTRGRLTRRRPRGAAMVCDNSSSAASISARMRRLRSRNSVPSAVSVTLRVLR